MMRDEAKLFLRHVEGMAYVFAAKTVMHGKWLVLVTTKEEYRRLREEDIVLVEYDQNSLFARLAPPAGAELTSRQENVLYLQKGDVFTFAEHGAEAVKFVLIEKHLKPHGVFLLEVVMHGVDGAKQQNEYCSVKDVFNVFDGLRGR